MTVFLYNIFISLFKTGVFLSSPWNDKARKWRRGRKNIFNKIKESLKGNRSPIIWMHCSSAGEFEQGRPVIERLRAQGTGHKVVLTFFSPSGYEANKNYRGADFIFYLPADTASNAKKILDLVQPSFVLWVKYEYWYHYLNEIKKREINCFLISAVFRENQSFFHWYGALQRKMISFFTHLFVQDEVSKDLVRKFTTANCTVSGDTRFDRVVEIAERFEPIPLVEKFIGDSKCVVAGSTWKEDEEVLQKVFDKMDAAKLKLIIAPHEIGSTRIEEVKKLFPSAATFSVLANSNQLTGSGKVLIIDNIGMLSRLYRYSYISYIGGGFTKDGVHNVLEAAVYGKPVIFGPNYQKYREAIDLLSTGGGHTFSDEEDLQKKFQLLLNRKDEYAQRSEAAKNYVMSNRGATERILSFIQEKRLLTN